MRWFRAKADYERWEEEVLLLQEELKRTHRTFRFLSDAWINSISRDKCKRGYSEYAHERASMYTRMANECHAAMVLAQVETHSPTTSEGDAGGDGDTSSEDNDVVDCDTGDGDPIEWNDDDDTEEEWENGSLDEYAIPSLFYSELRLRGPVLDNSLSRYVNYFNSTLVWTVH